MNKQTTEILEEIRTACPELMELSFGCKVMWSFIDEDGLRKDWREGTVIDVGEDVYDTCPGGIGHVQETVPYWLIYLDEPYTDCEQIIKESNMFDTKIIGKGPTVGHLLRAMQSLSDDDLNRHWVINRWGEFLRDAVHEEDELLKTLPVVAVAAKIDLTADLTQQLETNTELREFVHGLLVTKEK